MGELYVGFLLLPPLSLSYITNESTNTTPKTQQQQPG